MCPAQHRFSDRSIVIAGEYGKNIRDETFVTVKIDQIDAPQPEILFSSPFRLLLHYTSLVVITCKEDQKTG
jgi:hypothetical protein